MSASSLDQPPFGSMASSRDSPNPLRPYYVPPSIGNPPHSSATPSRPSNPRPFSSPNTSSTSSRDFRELFSDMEYDSYIGDKSEGVAELAKKLADQAIWNYTSVFLAQPFEVAKVVLQCYEPGLQVTAPSSPSISGSQSKWQRVESQAGYFDEDDDSDGDLPSYFTPTAAHETPSSPHGNRRRRLPTRSLSATPTPSSSAAAKPYTHTIELRHTSSVLEVLSQLWIKESAWGVWKGTNATFVYNVLLKTVETWARSLLSALLNLPDPTLISSSISPSSLGSMNIIDSSSPFASLGVAVAAAGIAGLLLAPLDLVRTRLIITPTSSSPRALIPSLRSLRGLTITPQLIPPTLLHSIVPPLISTSGPLFFRSNFGVDPVLTPRLYSISAFALSLSELFIRLPLETVLRRGHVSALASQSQLGHSREAILPLQRSLTTVGFKTVVPVGPYRGVWGTMWYIMREEGSSVSSLATIKSTAHDGLPVKVETRRGQGVYGLWRGWRVGFLGLVGVWGAAVMGSGNGGEF